VEKVETTIDMTDWAERALRAEDPPQTIKDVVALARKVGSREAGEMTVAWIEMGESPQELLPTCKILLGDGARMRIAHMVEGLEELFKINGHEYRVRALTKVVPEPEVEASEGDSPQFAFEVEAPVEEKAAFDMPSDGYVDAGSPESLENARRYLLTRVPGHVKPRLIEIKVAGGDPRAVLQELVSILWSVLGEIE